MRGKINSRALGHWFRGIFLGLNVIWQLTIESNAVAYIFDFNIDMRSLHGVHFYSVTYKLIRLTKIF